MSHRATEGRRQLSGAYLPSATLSRAADVIGSIAVPAAFAYNLIVPQLQSARRQSVARRCAAYAFDSRRRRCRRDPVSRTRQGASAALRPSPFPREMSVRSRDRAVPSPRGGSAGSRWPLTSLNGRFRDECLNEHVFRGLPMARRTLAARLQCLPAAHQPLRSGPERVCSPVSTGPQPERLLVISEGKQGAGSMMKVSGVGTSSGCDSQTNR